MNPIDLITSVVGTCLPITIFILVVFSIFQIFS
jgi:hypothetical protein